LLCRGGGGEKKEEEEEEEEKVHDDDDDDGMMMMMMMMRAFTTLCDEKRPRLWVHCHRLRGGGITREILSMRTTTMR